MVGLNVRRSGEGPPVVLLHPLGLDGRFWGSLPQKLARSRRVHAVDILGHGESPDAPRPGTMSALTQSVAPVIEGIGEPAVVIGVSLGGMVAQNLTIERPDLVAGLVLASCSAAIPEVGHRMMRQRARAIDEGPMDAIVEALIGVQFSPEFLDSELVQSVRERYLSNTPSNFAAAWEALSEHAALPRLSEVSVPTIVVVGDADKTTPLAAARTLSDAVQGSRYIEMEGAPHMVQLERGEEFAALVSEFMDALD